MHLSAPTMPIFIVSLVLAALAVIGAVAGEIPYVTENAFWVAVVAYIVLMFGNVVRGA